MARQSRRGAAAFLLTRPEAQSLRLADDLRARFGPDLRIVVSPLMAPVFLTPDLVKRDWSGLLFTSANGVEGAHRLSLGTGLPAWCVGDATAAAATAAGYMARSAAGDARDLVDLVSRVQETGPLLHLRGQEVSGNMARALNSAGIETQEAIVYRQDALPLSQGARDLLADTTPVIAPLYSPRTARLLSQALQAAPPCAPLLVAVISTTAANAVAFSPEQLVIASRPDGDAMLTAVAGLLATASQP